MLVQHFQIFALRLLESCVLRQIQYFERLLRGRLPRGRRQNGDLVQVLRTVLLGQPMGL